MKKIRHIFGTRGYMTAQTKEFDSDGYREQEKGAAWAYEGASLLLQGSLILLVAKAIPINFYAAITLCLVFEIILRLLLSSASRKVLALKDRGKKEINGKEILLGESWGLTLFLAFVGLLAWGSFGLISQQNSFEKTIGNIEYNQSERTEIAQAIIQFSLDSANARTILNQDISELSKGSKSSYEKKVLDKNKAVNTAQNAISTAIASNNIQAEVAARRQLVLAQSIQVNKQSIDSSDAENDYNQRIVIAGQKLATVKSKCLASAKARNGTKEFRHIFEISLYFIIVGLVLLCVYKLEEYKKLSNIEHFGFESLFAQKLKEAAVIEVEIKDRQMRLEIFERHGLTEKQLSSLKRNDSELLTQAERKLSQSGYILFFETGKTYPRLKKLKQVA